MKIVDVWGMTIAAALQGNPFPLEQARKDFPDFAVKLHLPSWTTEDQGFNLFWEDTIGNPYRLPSALEAINYCNSLGVEILPCFSSFPAPTSSLLYHKSRKGASINRRKDVISYWLKQIKHSAWVQLENEPFEGEAAFNIDEIEYINSRLVPWLLETRSQAVICSGKASGFLVFKSCPHAISNTFPLSFGFEGGTIDECWLMPRTKAARYGEVVRESIRLQYPVLGLFFGGTSEYKLWRGRFFSTFIYEPTHLTAVGREVLNAMKPEEDEVCKEDLQCVIEDMNEELDRVKSLLEQNPNGYTRARLRGARRVLNTFIPDLEEILDK